MPSIAIGIISGHGLVDAHEYIGVTKTDQSGEVARYYIVQCKCLCCSNLCIFVDMHSFQFHSLLTVSAEKEETRNSQNMCADCTDSSDY